MNRTSKVMRRTASIMRAARCRTINSNNSFVSQDRCLFINEGRLRCCCCCWLSLGNKISRLNYTGGELVSQSVGWKQGPEHSSSTISNNILRAKGARSLNCNKQARSSVYYFFQRHAAMGCRLFGPVLISRQLIGRSTLILIEFDPPMSLHAGPM